MSLLSWLFKKGIAGAISTDLVNKYLGIKSRHPNEEDKIILERLWNLWLTLNEDIIQGENDLDKIARLNIMKEEYENKSSIDSLANFKNLFDLYQVILYIETELLPADGKLWDNSVKVFIKESKKYGLYFGNEYKSFKRTLKIIGR